MENVKTRPTIWAVIITAAAAIVSLFVPIIYLILPALFAYLIATQPLKCFAPAAILSVAGTLILCGREGAYVLALYLPAGIVAGLLIRKGKMAYRDIAIITAALIGAGLYVVLCLPSVVEGNGPLGMMESIFQSVVDQVKLMTEGEMAEYFGVAEADLQAEIAALIGYLSDMKALLPTAMPALFCGVGCLGSILCVPLAQRWSRRAGLNIKPMAPFSRWQLPKEFVFGALILAVGSLVLSILKLDIAEPVWAASEVLIGFPLALQGLCVMIFILRGRRTGCLLPLIAVVLLVFALLVLIAILILVGAIEQSTHLRRKMIDSGNGPVS